jgi:hypothetical protein
MGRQKMVGGKLVTLTPDEETARDAEEQAWADGQPAREMVWIRRHRDRLLGKTDWMALGDVTMSDNWKTYRQALRDIPASNTVYQDVTWPTEPA